MTSQRTSATPIQTLAAAALTALALGAAPAWAQTAAGDAKASDAAFVKADKNGDGKLSKDEAAAMPAVASKFEMMDADKDGALSKAEFAAAPKE